MAGAIHGTKHQKLPIEQQEQPNNKFYYHFLYKATLVLIFFVILPFFPSQAPQFINQSLLTRNWELLHLLFVGVAISYGLFSRRNDETYKENNNNNNSKFDTAQSLVSRFLQVSSFFEDEAENQAAESDETKVQTWSSQHHRSEPVVVVAPKFKKHSSFDVQSGEKPLLLPIRSLKSRLSDEAEDVDDVQSLSRSMSFKRFSSNSNRKAEVEADDDDVHVQSLNRSTTFKRFSSNSNRNAVAEADAGDVDADVQSQNRSMSFKRFSSNSNRKTEVEADDADVDIQSLNRSTSSKRFPGNSNTNAEVEGSIVESKKKENVVLPSPIPWRSRSGRMEPNKQEEVHDDDDASNMMLPSKEESRHVKSQTSRAASSRASPVSSESLAKNAEDSARKKGFYKSCPPPPPPPPPMMFHKSVSMKPRYGGNSIFTEEPSFNNKELKRSFTSEKNMQVGKKVDEEKQSMPLVSVSQPEDKETFFVESDDDDDEDDDDDMETEDEDVGGGRGRTIEQNNDNGKGPPVIGASGTTSGDEGPDVDKKADEFIAKFREQIRLQRIESIKRSTRSARNSSR